MGAGHLSGGFPASSRDRDIGIFEKERETFVTLLRFLKVFQRLGPDWEGDLIWPYRLGIDSIKQRET